MHYKTKMCASRLIIRAIKWCFSLAKGAPPPEHPTKGALPPWTPTRGAAPSPR